MQRTNNVLISKTPSLRWLQYIVYGSLILYFGRSVFIPISFALLISFILYPLCAWLEKKGIGKVMAITLSISFLTLMISLVVMLLIYQFVSFFDAWPAIQVKVGQAMSTLQQAIEMLGFSKTEQKHIITRLSDQSGGSFISIVGSTLSASASSMVLLVLIPVYSVLILYYRHYWMKILSRLFPSERSEALREMARLTIHAYYNFIKGMALVYLAVGILNSIGLLALGVPHAILFGFIASILTFIPYVGIMVGALLPVAMAWITYDSIWYPVAILAIFTVVQYLEANVIFPFAVSNRLNVNTLAVLIAIFTGGLLWGMAGMILFVPFVGIAKLIADHNPKWKTVSMILGNSAAG